MRGQWIGEYTGTNPGRIIVNVDELPSYFQGVAYLQDSHPKLPGTAVSFRTKDKNKSCNVQTNQIYPVDPKTGVVSSWDIVKQYVEQDVKIPTSANAAVTWGSDTLKLSWVTDIGTNGKCTLPRSNADKPSELIPSKKDWEAYKNYVATLEYRRDLFRGQNEPRRLRTGFHRSGRSDLTRFLNEDIPVLHKHLSSRTKHVFNLQVPDENGAFFNLVQHHGYPTPLLDWTYSPYIAAFFAYRGISNEMAAKADPAAVVRIHMFDQKRWKSDRIQPSMLLSTSLYLSIGEFMAIENERMIPQQAATTITNIDDIETYIRGNETKDKKYLSAIDLPVSERKKVIRELSCMGITGGSLFPGLDGACEELRERNFDI